MSFCRELIEESDSIWIFGKCFGFSINRWIFANWSIYRPFVNFKENFKLLKSGQNSTGCPQKRRPTFDLMQVENDCIYTICFHIFLLLILQLKILYKAIQNRLKVCYRKLKFEDLLMTDDPTFSKNALTYSSHITLSNFTDISLATA